MTRFAIATLTPVLLLTCAALAGGGWVWAALGYMTLLVFALDQVRAWAAPAHPDAEFPAGTGLSVLLGLVHFPVLGLAVWLVSGASGAGVAERFGGFVAFSLFFGQVSNSNAHELIHRSDRWLRRLGVAVYSSVLYGHHASAHRLVHHVHVATKKDPNSARPGEHFYRYAWRASRGEYRAGKRAEDARRSVAAKGLHPFATYWLWALATLFVAVLIGGLAGPVSLIALALYAQLQLLLSDYVQHYGLQRRMGPDGKPEPCGPAHSWNTPHWYSSALMLNAPRHSDHHLRPSVEYPGLVLDEEAMPTLPYSLPVMALLALWPARWRKVMDPRVAEWQQKAHARHPAAM